MKNWLVTALIALVFGFAGAGLFSLSGLSHQATRSYLVAHPEILPQMADAYQRRETETRLAGLTGEVTQAFPGAVLGNPNGKRTLVKFTDYGCTYCRASMPDVDRLIAEDKDLKVVIREWPIFEGSEHAARMGLAAARQGKFAAYYHAMFEQGPPSEETIARAGQAAGLDMAAAEAFAKSEQATAALAANSAYANQLGFTGTPSWIAGKRILQGYVGHDRLADALADEAG